MMRVALIALFLGFLLAMLAVTTYASFDRNVLTAAQEIWADPWGKATLFDTYFAFLTVYLWIAWRERTWGRRILWLALVLTLGSIAISVYVLAALLSGPDRSVEGLFRRRREA
ncbi:MAG: DUF1475 family protein [Acidobacteriota bacterium]